MEEGGDHSGGNKTSEDADGTHYEGGDDTQINADNAGDQVVLHS